MDAMKITLAGQEYEIDMLTLEQLEELHVAAVIKDSPDEGENVRAFYKRCLGVIAACLVTKHPAMTVDAMRKMKITRNEMVAANNACLKFSGLTPGEVGAAAPGSASEPAKAKA